ncbi:MAG: hypothetical protein V3V74_07660 [Nitrosomonadaceae bacterium]
MKDATELCVQIFNNIEFLKEMQIVEQEEEIAQLEKDFAAFCLLYQKETKPR